MEKEFVTYEQALALQELGFDELCLSYYLSVFNPRIGSYIDFKVTTKIDDSLEAVKAPLKQQVFRWFREEHGLIGTPQYLTEGHYCFTINDMKDTKESNRLFTEYLTYEEAENACIDKLIEIAKQQDNDKD
jgi:hypothetical protein